MEVKIIFSEKHKGKLIEKVKVVTGRYFEAPPILDIDDCKLGAIFRMDYERAKQEIQEFKEK